MKLVHLADYNDVEQLTDLMARRGDRVAAIIFEPVMGAGGIVAARPEFLHAAAELAQRHGALLIIDEVITARLHVGGQQNDLGLKPDLTVFGKIIGGGLPVGAFGGREDVMSLFDPRRPGFIAHGGTFNGNAAVMAGGCATLDLLSQPEIDRINRLGQLLADRLRNQLASAGLTAVVTNVGSLLQLHFDADREPSKWSEVNIGSPLASQFHRSALEEGVFLAPRGLVNISTAMDDDIVEDIAERLRTAAERVASADSD
jgi:glutamate-1-semialdehyde 2,1-aminomutase